MHIEESIAGLLPVRSRWRTIGRAVGWTVAILYFLFAILVLALRYWLLPAIGSQTGFIEKKASEALGERVTIGSIEAGWQGLRPELLLTQVTVFDRSGRPALSLPVVDATLAWSSLLRGPRFDSLILDRPNLDIRRDAAGKIHVAGFELRTAVGGGDSAVADWLLGQREIVVRDGRLTWEDELRHAPVLRLDQLNFVLRNGFTAHRFALRAKPPAEIASTLDLRGESDGEDWRDLSTWSGRLYAELEYADLGALKQWIDYPMDLASGRGGLRTWLGFRGDRLTELTADVALADVTTRLADDLPLLQLSSLQGRVSMKQTRNAVQATAKSLTLRTADGVVVEPTDFTLRWEPGGGKRSDHAEFASAAVRLGPLARLAEYLPLPPETRSRIAALDPRGSLSDLKLQWTGRAGQLERYSIRGRFSGLAALPFERLPGFSDFSGRVDASEKGGSVILESEHAALQWPGILPEREASFDRLTAQVDWKLASDRLEMRFARISVANRDVAGTLFGSFATKAGSRGVIDLTGNFTGAEGEAVYRYIPWLPASVADYLKKSVRGGRSDDVKLRLKGDLSGFPFSDPSQGTFRVLAKLRDVKFRFADSWPELDDVAGVLEFEGRTMRVTASRATMQGAHIQNVRAVIPDLYNGNEHLRIDGEAEDQVTNFLRFVDASPVNQMLGGFTTGMQASGNGKLQLRLDLPIRQLDKAKIAGNYQFLGDQIRIHEDLPPLTQVRGQLDFTESTVTARAIAGQFLGGPLTIAVATSEGIVTVNAGGTANAASLPRVWGGSLLKQVSGTSAWQATVTGGKGRPVNMLVESQLAGVAIDLPAPFSKRPSEVLPLRFERVLGVEGPGGRRSEQFRVSLGQRVGAQFSGRVLAGRFVLDRGAVSFNQPAVLPMRRGISVTGNLQYFDVDRWRTLLTGDGAEKRNLGPLLVDVKIAAVDFAGKRIHDVALQARPVGSDWEADIAAKELAGRVTWHPEGRGKISARLKHLIVPDSAPGAPTDEAPSREMPALDIVADSFTLRGKQLGRLELLAVNEEGEDWRIEKLVVASEESTLSATGTWQSWADMPSITVDFKLDVNDIGKYLDRIGFPGTMRRGSAVLQGKVGWQGSPSAVDYPTLSGSLNLTASKGQFLKADPGVAKLLGILSLQSWVTLDFRDMFAQGFGFDSVSSSAAVASGILTTEDFHMRGPSAQVSMNGTVDLVHETQNLVVRVVPSLGDAASWIPAILVNPVWGIGSLVLQRILKDPLGQILAFEYRATGSWTNPQVERVRAEVRSAEASP